MFTLFSLKDFFLPGILKMFSLSQALLSLTTVFLMWFAHPKFRDSESLATGLVAVGLLAQKQGVSHG